MRVFALTLLALAAVAVAKNTLMHGPPGELPKVLAPRNAQDADADLSMVTYSGNTRFRNRFYRPDYDCSLQDGEDPEDGWVKSRWSAKGLAVSQTGQYSILSAQRFDGSIFVYQDGFRPGGDDDYSSANEHCLYGNGEDLAYPDDIQNNIRYSALNDVMLQRGVRYIIVTTGEGDSDRGRFQNYIWGPAGSEIWLEEKGCAEVGCDDDSFTDTCGCDEDCWLMCDCCYDYCDECHDDTPTTWSNDNCGNVQGDPHYAGFTGERYNVKGEVGKIYNLITDANIQVNAQYDFGCKPDTTVLSTIAILYDDHKLQFNQEGLHNLNGDDLAPGTRTFLNEENTAWVDRHSVGGLRLVTPEYTISLKATESKCGLFHLDMNTQLRNPNLAPHGLLGQTASEMRTRSVPSKDARPDQGAGVIEGSVEDYTVSHLFARDHVFNKFGEGAMPAAVPSKRA